MIEECYTYNIMPDHGTAPYGWVIRPGEIRRGIGGNMADASGWFGDHPISNQLESDFAEWIQDFERNVSYLTEVDLVFDWENYHKRGFALARRLKAELGSEVRVRYIKPGEDPHRDIDTCSEIYLDFAPPKSATVPLELHELPYYYSPKEQELKYINAAGISKTQAILCYFLALAQNTCSLGFILNRVSDDVIFNTDHFCVQGKERFTDCFQKWIESYDNHDLKCYELGKNPVDGNLCVIEHIKLDVNDAGIGKQVRRIDVEADLNGVFNVISILTIDDSIKASGAGLFPGIEDEYIQYQLSYKLKLKGGK